MKKSKLIIPFIILIIVILFALFLRNFFLLSHVINLSDNHDNFRCTLVSYEADKIDEKTSTVYYKKGNLSKSVTSKPEYTEIVTWKDKQADEGLSRISADHTAFIGKSSKFSTLDSLPTFSDTIEGNTKFNSFLYSLTHFITTEKIDGLTCLVVSFDHDTYWVDQETGWIRKILSKDSNQSDYVIEYDPIQIDVVTDQDVEKPDLTNYTLKEIS